MKHILEENNSLVDNINKLWNDAQVIAAQLEQKRNEAAVALRQLSEIVTECAQKTYNQSSIRLAPIISNNLMVGLRVWIGDVCHILKAKEIINGEEAQQKAVEIGQTENEPRTEVTTEVGKNNAVTEETPKDAGRHNGNPAPARRSKNAVPKTAKRLEAN